MLIFAPLASRGAVGLSVTTVLSEFGSLGRAVRHPAAKRLVATNAPQIHGAVREKPPPLPEPGNGRIPMTPHSLLAESLISISAQIELALDHIHMS